MKLPTPEEITRSLEELLRRQAQPFRKKPAAEAAPAREKKRGMNLLVRAVTGLSLAGLTILLIVVHPHAFAFEVMFFVAIGVKELCDLARRNGVDASFTVAAPCALALVACASWFPQLMSPLLAGCVVVTMACMTFRKRKPVEDGVPRSTRYIDGIVTIYAFMYTGWLFSFCLQIRTIPGQIAGPNGSMVDLGAAYLLMLISSTAFSDVGCYAFGKMFGRHQLAPAISPGKTIEGSLGGLLVSAFVAFMFGQWLGLPLGQCLLYGAVVSAVAQLGDLWESMMKREAGVKDSGRALAGHGGVLDRFDSFFYAMPIGWLLTNYMLLHRSL